MILSIDGYEANVKNRVGIGQYAFEILHAMHKELRNRSDSTRVYVYLPNTPLPDMPKQNNIWKYRVVGPKQFWTFLALPWNIRFDLPKADVVFSPTHYVPRFIHTPRVPAIMDMSFIMYKNLFTRRDLYKLIRWTAYSAKHADKIVTISAFSKNAIIKAYNIPKKRITVTYPGLSMNKITEASDFLKVKEKYGVSKYYILAVGTLQPRKNYVRLIRSFSEFLKKNKQRFRNIQLVIAGKKGWMYEKILRTAESLGIEASVTFLDFVSDKELAALYKHALCLANVSLYEGFGLPVLEAMAHGCPVVVSNVSSLPEIARDAAVYVDPNDTESITRGLLDAVRQRNLMQGKTRVKKGKEQVKQFSWEKAAKQTLDILEQVAKGS